MKEESRNGGVMKSALMALLKFIFEGRGDDPLSLLKDDYRREKTLAANLRAHAESMPYQHYRDELMGLAQMSEEGADLLGRKIAAMGESLPEVPAPDAGGGTLWEKLAEDVGELNSLYHRYLSQSGADEDLKGLLGRLREDKNHQSSAIQGLLRGLHGYSL